SELKHYSNIPLQLNPSFVQQIRQALPSWEKLTQKLSGALGFLLKAEADFVIVKERLSWPECHNYCMTFLRTLYAIRYLIKEQLEPQQPLLDALRLLEGKQFTLGDIPIIKLDKQEIVFLDENFDRLETEILMNLATRAPEMKNYYSMRELQFKQHQQMYDELVELDLVSGKNPFQWYTSWRLTAEKNNF
ncbi:MAG: hypothetical protein KDH94_03405, partial [Coxiellaceae bacterium]|nr:hypothetical protein [Coxiellaceae bacterium]